MHSNANLWYVAFSQTDKMRNAYTRNSKTFRTEIEAKQFARECLEQGCDVSAGTLNPYRPKRSIGPLQIAGWLEADG